MKSPPAFQVGSANGGTEHGTVFQKNQMLATKPYVSSLNQPGANGESGVDPLAGFPRGKDTGREFGTSRFPQK